MTEDEPLELRLKREILEAYRGEYDSLLSTFRDLDAKGSGVIGVAGIFLAAAFAFVEKGSAEAAPWLLAVLLLTLAGLVGSILAALAVLQARQVVRPPAPRKLEEMVSHLLADGEAAAEERLGDYYGQHLAQWRGSIGSLTEANRKKSRWLIAAQVLLVASVVLAAVLTLGRMG